jgi:LuxR family transcriptional regulator, maltose regulon positive regulatory protein
VSSIDTGRTWFRYHHLFADLLRLELRRLSPASIKPLHRAAAEWHEEHGDVVEAIRHAQTAGDWPDATRMVADKYISLVFDGRLATLRALLSAFPKDAAADPELAVVFAGARQTDGRLDESAHHLAVAGRTPESVPAERRGRFDVQRAGTTLALARRRGDLRAVLESVRAVETALSVEPTVEIGDDVRAFALMNLGIAELWASRTEDAREHLEQALNLTRRIGRPYLELACLGHLAMALVLVEQPAAASLALCEQALDLAVATDGSMIRVSRSASPPPP